MLSRNVSAWPWGGDVPMPGPPLHTAPDQPAGLSGPLPVSRLAGRDQTLTVEGPCGAGDLGWTGRDPADPADTVPESHGMFYRLHQEGM